jgi:hypothetical protein
MSNLSFKHIKKIYDNGFEAVKDINLEIQDGEFIILLAPRLWKIYHPQDDCRWKRFRKGAFH